MECILEEYKEIDFPFTQKGFHTRILDCVLLFNVHSMYSYINRYNLRISIDRILLVVFDCAVCGENSLFFRLDPIMICNERVRTQAFSFSLTVNKIRVHL